MHQKLGELLIRNRLLSDEQLEEALKLQQIYGGRLGTNLVELGYVDIETLARMLSEQRRFPVAAPAQFEAASAQTLALLPAATAEKHLAFPLRQDGHKLHIALASPFDPSQVDPIGFLTGLRIVAYIAPELRLLFYHERRYGIARPARYIRIASDSGKGQKTASQAPTRIDPVLTAPTVTVRPEAPALFGQLRDGEFLSGGDTDDIYLQSGGSLAPGAPPQGPAPVDPSAAARVPGTAPSWVGPPAAGPGIPAVAPPPPGLAASTAPTVRVPASPPAPASASAPVGPPMRPPAIPAPRPAPAPPPARSYPIPNPQSPTAPATRTSMRPPTPPAGVAPTPVAAMPASPIRWPTPAPYPQGPNELGLDTAPTPEVPIASPDGAAAQTEVPLAAAWEFVGWRRDASEPGAATSPPEPIPVPDAALGAADSLGASGDSSPALDDAAVPLAAAWEFVTWQGSAGTEPANAAATPPASPQGPTEDGTGGAPSGIPLAADESGAAASQRVPLAGAWEFVPWQSAPGAEAAAATGPAEVAPTAPTSPQGPTEVLGSGALLGEDGAESWGAAVDAALAPADAPEPEFLPLVPPVDPASPPASPDAAGMASSAEPAPALMPELVLPLSAAVDPTMDLPPSLATPATPASAAETAAAAVPEPALAPEIVPLPAATDSRSAAPPAPPTAADASPPAAASLDEIEASIRLAEDRDAVADALLRYCAGRFSRAVLFIVHNGRITGWRGFGPGVDLATVGEIAVPLRDPSMFRAAHDARRPHAVSAPSTPADEDLFARFGSRPAQALAVPVALRGRPVNFVYGDCGPRPLPPFATEELARAAAVAAQAYERLIRVKKSAD